MDFKSLSLQHDQFIGFPLCAHMNQRLNVCSEKCYEKVFAIKICSLLGALQIDGRGNGNRERVSGRGRGGNWGKSCATCCGVSPVTQQLPYHSLSPTFPHRCSADNEIVASAERKRNFSLCSVFIKRRQANILNTKGYAWARTRSPFTVTLMKRLKFTALRPPPRLVSL